jgi:hypothetical protein
MASDTTKTVIGVVIALFVVIAFVVALYFMNKYCSGEDGSIANISGSKSFVNASGKKSQANRVQELNTLYRGTLPNIK